MTDRSTEARGNLYKLKNLERWKKVAIVLDLTKFQIEERKKERESICQAMMAKKQFDG